MPGRSTTATLKRVHSGEGQEVAQVEEPPAVPAGPLLLGVLGSGYGSNLEAIQRAIEEGRLDAEIRVVISDNAGARILQVAHESGVPALYVNPGEDAKRLGTSAQQEISDLLQQYGVEVVVLTGFMRVVKDPLLSVFRDRIVNVHPSLLPKYKGKEAWVQALEEGEIETGCTVHLVNADLDGGRILAQGKVPILIGDKAEEVLARIQAVEHQLLPKVLGEWHIRRLPTT